MIFKKFEAGEVLRNTIKVFPKNDIYFDSSGSQFIKNLSQITPVNQNNSALIVGNAINFSSNNYFLTVDVNASNASRSPILPNGINPYNFSNTSNYKFTTYPSSSISIIPITSSAAATYSNTTSNSGITQRYKINALKNTIDWYSSIAASYQYFNYSSQDVTIINIPSTYYGSSIKQGSIRLDFYFTGTLLASAEDYRLNGELVESTGSNTGSVIGVVFYNEGLILLSGSWALNTGCRDYYSYVSGSNLGKTVVTDNPRWVHFGKSLLSASLLQSSSFNLSFQGTDYINSLTLFAHADKNEFNYTNNKTSLQVSQSNYGAPFTSSNLYAEDKELLLKNTVKTDYETVSGSYKKQSFINKIGIYDQNKRLIAVAKLATPVKKNNEREYTFKLKLDI
jgi:hypothetical protein